MNLSGALELKDRLISLANDPAFHQGMMKTAGIASTRLARVVPGTIATIRARMMPDIAIGIAPGQSKRTRDFRLALRVFGSGSLVSEALISAMPDLRSGDLEIVRGVHYAPRLTLRAGGSIGHPKITAGTLGAFVEDDHSEYILSNNHVLADSNRGRPGDPIWQPGRADIVNGQKAIVGELSRFSRLQRNRTDHVDAALATFSERVHYFEPWHYKGIGDMDPNPISDRYASASVIKRGRTTAVTSGKVSVYSLDGVRVNFGTNRVPQVYTFNEQMEFVHDDDSLPFSQGGDSGSLILDRDSLRPLALLFAGGTDSNGIDRTIGHHIPAVLSDLGVRFIQ